MPVEPAPTTWALPPPTDADDHGIVGIGADLLPGTLLAAYRRGLFPMPVRADGPIAWWSPDPRGILPLDELHVSRSLRRSIHRYEVRIDTAFEAVIDACADITRQGAWINRPMRDAYVELHRLGWAHSIESWDAEGLAGGLYGLAVGGLFAGESMFHRGTDASKVALVRLVELLRRDGDRGRLLDVQWLTPHLESLGAVEVSRARYSTLLKRALESPLPDVLARG